MISYKALIYNNKYYVATKVKTAVQGSWLNGYLAAMIDTHTFACSSHVTGG